ncbi:MAG: flagellar basal body protein, partial [Mariprofundaceae bacterium]|nr:flagellar basal body protein [Mariprofundaceae bacterium]
MQRGFFISGVASTMAQHRLDKITHNLANVNTTGYKASRSSFQTVMSDNLVQVGKTQKSPAAYLDMG